MRSMQNRLRALEMVSNGTAKASAADGEFEQLISGCERMAVCLVAWGGVHNRGDSVDEAIGPMLAYYPEPEARRLLGLDYDSIYRAIGGPMANEPAEVRKG